MMRCLNMGGTPIKGVSTRQLSSLGKLEFLITYIHAQTLIQQYILRIIASLNEESAAIKGHTFWA